MCAKYPNKHGDVNLAARLLRVLLLTGFVGGIAAGCGAWFLLPKGFPVAHARFWANSVLPPVVAAACLLSLVALHRKQDAIVKPLVLCLATLLVAAAIAGAILFPQSVSGRRLVLVVVGIVITLAAVGFTFWLRKARSVSVGVIVACVLVGVLIGSWLPWSQRALDAATKPYREQNVVPPPAQAEANVYSLALTGQCTVFPQGERVTLKSDAVSLDVYPLLTFESRSPDRCWSILSPRALRIESPRTLIGSAHDVNRMSLDYRSEGSSGEQARLQVNMKAADHVELEALTYLPQAVYSHLNAYCDLYIYGKGKLSLSFSPCPQQIELTPSDYPVGRPVRLAYLDAEGRFHVVEASSGEKGPYTELAAGELDREQPLEITVYDDGTPIYRIALNDWAAQASTQLSPTAGWGLPENAFQFSLIRHSDRRSEGVVFVTLAGTSIGRGFDTVGHAPGTYRNRMVIEAVGK